jgi:phosphatidylglycerol---prolipoprotein diacylglyceryl transferase
MYPVVFHLGPFPVRSYGIALALSFLLGCGLALRRARARGYSEDLMFGLFFWIIAAAIVGARAHFVLAHPAFFVNPVDAFRLWDGGLTLYGGLIAALLASWLYLARHRVPFLAMADICCPSLALGEGITRIGCFFNGCCFGHAGHGLFCVRYPAGSFASDALNPQAPVEVVASQLLLSAALLLATGGLLLAGRRLRGAGRLFGLFLVVQGVVRWAVDFTRYYEPIDRIEKLGPLITTKSQLIALGLVAWGVWLLVRRVRGAAVAGAKV